MPASRRARYGRVIEQLITARAQLPRPHEVEYGQPRAMCDRCHAPRPIEALPVRGDDVPDEIRQRFGNKHGRTVATARPWWRTWAPLPGDWQRSDELIRNDDLKQLRRSNDARFAEHREFLQRERREQEQARNAIERERAHARQQARIEAAREAASKEARDAREQRYGAWQRARRRVGGLFARS